MVYVVKLGLTGSFSKNATSEFYGDERSGSKRGPVLAITAASTGHDDSDLRRGRCIKTQSQNRPDGRRNSSHVPRHRSLSRIVRRTVRTAQQYSARRPQTRRGRGAVRTYCTSLARDASRGAIINRHPPDCRCIRADQRPARSAERRGPRWCPGLVRTDIALRTAWHLWLGADQGPCAQRREGRSLPVRSWG